MSERRARRRLMNEINVVPYIDVMLVLLIIFMISAPMLQRGIEVNLPVASRSQEIAATVADPAPVLQLIVVSAVEILQGSAGVVALTTTSGRRCLSSALTTAPVRTPLY